MDGCSECGETRDLNASTGKCLRHQAAYVRSIALEEQILATCAKVLNPTNQNLIQGDVLGSVRDVAQMAMATKERQVGRDDYKRGDLVRVTVSHGREGEREFIGRIAVISLDGLTLEVGETNTWSFTRNTISIELLGPTARWSYGGVVWDKEAHKRTHDNKVAPLGQSIAEVIADSARFTREAREELQRQDAQRDSLQAEHYRLAAQTPFLTLYPWDAQRTIQHASRIAKGAGGSRVYVNTTEQNLAISREHHGGVDWFYDDRIPAGYFGVAP